MSCMRIFERSAALPGSKDRKQFDPIKIRSMMPENPYLFPVLQSEAGKFNFHRSRRTLYWLGFQILLFSLPVAFGHSAELTLNSIKPARISQPTLQMPDQLPQSRIARGTNNITLAWLAGPTQRYRHGVLGDELEAERLVVETRSGMQLRVKLSSQRVFEDLEPRLADIDGDSRDEIIVVESDTKLGASLSVYGIIDGRLVRVTATPFLGQRYRWLNPLGVGDFDGDESIDIALVATPHIGGILRLYQFDKPTLSMFAERSGISTHRMGSTELGLGRVVSADPRDQLMVPDQRRQTLMLLEWTPDGWNQIARTELPGQLNSSLKPTGEKKWRFQLKDGRHFEVRID